MASEKTLEILREMKADPKAKELFEGMEKPKSPDEAISAYAQVAEKLGYAITAEDIKEAIEQEEARKKAKTEKVVSDMEALEDDDLEGVAGGFYRVVGLYNDGSSAKEYNKCVDNFVETNCWLEDACEKFVEFYYDCSGRFLENEAEYDCYWYDFWMKPV